MVPSVKYVTAKMLRNIIALFLTTNQQLDKYHVTWIWIQFPLRWQRSNITLKLENKLDLGKTNASVILTVKIE